MSVRVCYLLGSVNRVSEPYRRVLLFFTMDNEKLIEIVRDYKYLYDLTDKKYSDNMKKDQAWKEIGIKLKKNGTECKKAWALLRDAFRRTIKKKKKQTKSGQGIPNKKWKYEDEMSFLLPYMKERPTIRPIPTVPASDIDDNTNEEEDIALSPEVGQNITDTRSSTPEASQQMTDPLLTTLSQATTDYPQRTNRGQKRTDETPIAVLMKYIIDSKKNIPPQDDIEQFMAGITTTLRTFPPRDRAIAKAKIFEIVSRMEIDILSSPTTKNESTLLNQYYE
ncbi:transcription factor Adf-1 [Bicyclus anynana]|uniref:Transcription factor Adf-1 n=1 Tax=Bicyclus anynana TaxID=110368 RepID=A0A6J1P364_BICAN|nr:transcription factor Adf-1 [Bicyclus anynana]